MLGARGLRDETRVAQNSGEMCLGDFGMKEMVRPEKEEVSSEEVSSEELSGEKSLERCYGK